jgi:hypothetical protein
MPLKEDSQTDNSTLLFPFVYDSKQKRTISSTHNEVVFPSDISLWAGYRRIPPTTGFVVNQVINVGQEIHTKLVTQGHLQKIVLEISMSTSDALASVFNPYDIFQKIELEADAGNYFRTAYPEELWVINVLQRDLLSNNYKRNLEQMQANYTPNSPTIAAGAGVVTKFVLEYRVLDGSQPDLRILNQQLNLKITLNPPSSFVQSGSLNVQLASWNTTLKEVNMPLYKPGVDLWYRYMNYVKQNFTQNLAPSTGYPFQLTSFKGYSAYLLFMIRPGPVSTNAVNAHNYISAIDNFEFRDATNNIIAINNSPMLNQYWLGQEFKSDFLSQAGHNVFVIPFAMNVLGCEDGQVTGGMQMTAQETLQIYTSSSFVAGSYEICVYTANYEFYSLNKDGSLTFTK